MTAEHARLRPLLGAALGVLSVFVPVRESRAQAPSSSPAQPSGAAPAAPVEASAQRQPDTTRPPPPPAWITDRSPQNFAVELRLGPYAPHLNNTSAPLRESFFGDTRRYFVGFEVDWQVARLPYLGTIGVGAGFGYTRMSGLNQLPSGEPDELLVRIDDEVVLNGDLVDDAPTVPITQKSTLHVLPMHAVGVLRVDVLAEKFGVPLVPYGKLGLGWALWWVNDGLSTARSPDGTLARGTSVGIQAGLGAMLLLDFFEQDAARTVDSESGVNNTYLFLEWAWSDFGGEQMNVGTNTWLTGLAIEF